MIQEEKELLLKDLCARLPYGLKMQVTLDLSYDTSYNSVEQNCDFVATLYAINIDGDPTDIRIHHENNDIANYLNELFTDCPDILEDFIPYLRPMSSMTGEEVKEFAALESIDVLGGDTKITCVELSVDAIDWLNKKMFDYRGLIHMGLVLEAPEEIYNTKTE